MAPPLARELAEWAAHFEPDADDLALADAALRDTLAVAAAGARDPAARLAAGLGDGGSLAFLAHLVDFDDLHFKSTSHISAVCVPAALTAGGDARSYLVGAGVMARLGSMLGWSHYAAGWHATCTAGAPSAAAAAARAARLDADGIATAIALAIPSAGGVQRAFGSEAKSLQVAFAVEAGLRAARLAADGAKAEPAAVDDWMRLVGGTPSAVVNEPAVPGGLAVKLFPCCYALQRPIHAVQAALANETVEPAAVVSIRVTAPASSMQPLIHHRPQTGHQGKFSLEYGIAATIVDGSPGLGSFTDDAVLRPEAVRLTEAVTTTLTDDGDGLLAGRTQIDLHVKDGAVLEASLDLPPGAPGRVATQGALRRKIDACCGADADAVARADWASASDVARLIAPAPPRPA